MATVRYLVNDINAALPFYAALGFARRIAVGYLSQLWKRAISSYG